MRRYALIVLLCLTAFVLTACGGKQKAERDEISVAAEGLLSAMQSGDLAGMYEHCTAYAMDVCNVSQRRTLDALEMVFLTEIGAENTMYVSDSYFLAQLEAKRSIGAALVQSYTIDSASKQYGVGTVKATVEYGFDPVQAEAIDATALVRELVDEYMGVYGDSLEELRAVKGDEAVQRNVIDDLGGSVLIRYLSSVLSTGVVTKPVTLTVEQVDGTWRVTDYTFK